MEKTKQDKIIEQLENKVLLLKQLLSETEQERDAVLKKFNDLKVILRET